MYVTSLDPLKRGVVELGRMVRGHWSVENHLHWSLGVSFVDDGCGVR